MKIIFTKLPFAELLLFVLIFIFTIHPVDNFDFWFHVKYGEHILQTRTLPFTDTFSHTAFGNPAVPYEWLFQVLIYLVFASLGTVGVQGLVTLLAVFYAALFRQILVEIFRVGLLGRMFLVAASYVIGYDFWVERPQSLAYVLFLIVLYLVLKRVVLGKNWLWLSVPIFFIWTNMHASMILGLYLFFSFAGIEAIKYFRTKNRDFLSSARSLALFGLINTGVTVLPPLGTHVYQLLYLFFEKRDFIMRVIDEWVPLYQLTFRFYLYLVFLVAAGLSLVVAFFTTKGKRNLYPFLPLVPLGIFVISGVRQTQFSFPAILLCLIPLVNRRSVRSPRILVNILLVAILLALSVFSYLYKKEIAKIPRLYPTAAIGFIESNLTGNMFNEYRMGGFLMYKLGPKVKTFIDGRTDMFLPTVLPEYSELLNTYRSDSDAKSYFDQLIDRYDVSWAIVTTERYTPVRMLVRLLRQDSRWHLVFFDDTSEIYVKEDGKNDSVIANYGASSATPFGKSLYKPGQKEQARQEYQKMNALAPSAVTLNALGYMLLEVGTFDQAKNLFVQALEVNPSSAAPKMNLAEIATKDNNWKQAIDLYKKAIADDPQRGLAYLRLGQIMVMSGKPRTQAYEVWEKGLAATPDKDILEKLRDELSR